MCSIVVIDHCAPLAAASQRGYDMTRCRRRDDSGVIFSLESPFVYALRGVRCIGISAKAGQNAEYTSLKSPSRTHHTKHILRTRNIY